MKEKLKMNAKCLLLSAAVAALGLTSAAEVATPDMVQLWAGGPYFSTCNLGATKPEDFGNLYNYNEAAGAVTAALGEGWRVPTKAVMQALLNNCTKTWETRKDSTGAEVVGYCFTGKGDYATKSIFLPAAGYDKGNGRYKYNNSGLYRASTLESGKPLVLNFYFGNVNISTFAGENSGYELSNGLSVRPVLYTSPDMVQLWENGPYFATCNLGAASPGDFGDLYNYADAAGAVPDTMGEGWRWPSKNDMQGLLDNCTRNWENCKDSTGADVVGYRFTSKSNQSKSIFLPAAGYDQGSGRGSTDSGLYRVSTLEDNAPLVFNFYWKEVNISTFGGDRGYGLSVRAVRDTAPVTVTLNAQGGTGGAASVEVIVGTALPTITLPTKEGYTFAGYFDAETDGVKYYNADGTCAKAWDKTTATTLYAQWEAVEIPVEGDVKVKVDDEWIKEHDLEGKTEKEIAEELAKTDTDGTGLKKWQNWALGVDDGDTNAKPVIKSAAKGAAGKVALGVPSYKENAKSGVTATRKLILQRTAVGAAERTSDLALDATEIEVNEADVDESKPVALYKTVIEFSNGESVKSENLVGVMHITTGMKKAMVAVPWEQIGGGEISAADLIDTRDLADGDKLHVYDKANGRYKTWALKDSAWSPLGTYKIEAGKVSESSAGAPDDMTIARGDGVWLERGNTEKPFHLIGQYSAEKVTLPVAAGWNICGNAGIEKAAVADLGAGDGDTIIVPMEAEPIRYTKKDGAWGRYVETVTEVKGRKVKTSEWVSGGAIDVGLGFWLVKPE